MLKAKGNEIAVELKRLAKELVGENGTQLHTHPAKGGRPPQDDIIASPIQALIVTGTNIRLKKDLEQLEFPDYITARIYGHVENMASLMHACDLTVGKAGPNIIFESCAAGKPFLATYHIKGQEDGNLDFIRSTQIGFVEENPKKAAELIKEILKNPKFLSYTKRGIEMVENQHKQAAEMIAKEISIMLR
jgi:UDP-N-acetylglucosamine:LPS N-acetylglucosamine transferase